MRHAWPDFSDLVVGQPALAEQVPNLRLAHPDGESTAQRYERIMRFVLTVRNYLKASPTSPPALAALATRIMSAQGYDVPVVCGFPLGDCPAETVKRVLAICVLFGMPAQVVTASEGKAARLAAILATQRQEEGEASHHAQ